MSPARFYRWLALVSAALWFGALALPALVTPIEGEWGDAMALQNVYGWELLLLGWAAPLQVAQKSFAWFANPLWLWCVWWMWNGRAPNPWVTVVGPFIALTGLAPIHIEFGDDHGVNGRSHPGVGAYVWVAAFAPVVVARMAGWYWWLRSQPQAGGPDVGRPRQGN